MSATRFESPEVAAAEFRRRLAEVKVTPSETESDLTGVWPSNAVSDHLPRDFDVPIGGYDTPVPFTTWNMLNAKYLHYMYARDGQGLHNFRCICLPAVLRGDKSAEAALASTRLEMQLEFITTTVMVRGRILCVQECSLDVLACLREMQKDDRARGLQFRTTYVNETADNFNVVIYNAGEWVESCEEQMFTHEDNRAVLWQNFRSSRLGALPFTVCNVHIPFHDATKYAESLIALGPHRYSRDIVMLGDFNISVREPRPAADPADTSDNINLFFGYPFLFAVPGPADEPYSAPNCLKNAGDRARMLDMLDHCVLYPLELQKRWAARCAVQLTTSLE